MLTSILIVFLAIYGVMMFGLLCLIFSSKGPLCWVGIHDWIHYNVGYDRKQCMNCSKDVAI